MIALTDEQTSIVDNYRTCEFATVTKSGVPIAWPTTSVHRADGTFAISTSIGFSLKALNVRRNGDVAMLFSNPTASGLSGETQVLVQGLAECPEQIETGFLENADLWKKIFTFQPSGRKYARTAIMRRLMDVYFLRLMINVTPSAIVTRIGVPGATDMGPTGTDQGDDPLTKTLSALAAYPSSVLAAFDSAGKPTLTRVTLTRDEAGALIPAVPEGFDVQPGRASLLSHRHDENLWDLHSFVTSGELAATDSGWVFTPASFTESAAANSAMGAIRSLRSLRANGARYLAKRDLPRPKVQWQEFQTLAAEQGWND